MITDSKKWHCLAVKSLAALFGGITSKHVGDFYCLNLFYSYSTKNTENTEKYITFSVPIEKRT